MQFEPVSQLLIPLVTFLIGGGLARAFDWFRRVKKDDRDFYKNELDLFKTKCTTLEERIRVIELGTVPDVGATWVRDNKGFFLDVSTAFEIEFLLPNGLRRDDVIGKNLKDIYNPKMEAFVRVLEEMSVEALSSIKRYSVRYGVKVPNNERCHLMIKEVAVSSDNKIYFVGRAYIIDDVNCSDTE
jgi:hypothetical protein